MLLCFHQSPYMLYASDNISKTTWKIIDSKFQSDMKNNEKTKLVRDGTTCIEPEDINL